MGIQRKQGTKKMEYNIMAVVLHISDIRILLCQIQEKGQEIRLKMSTNSKIFNVPSLQWNSFCERWEINTAIKVACPKHEIIMIELYIPKSKEVPQLLGQCSINESFIDHQKRGQLKLALLKEGNLSGWLYCKISEQHNDSSSSNTKYIYIYKIYLSFLQECDHNIGFQLYQNEKPSFNKQFHIYYKDKSLFPNIKMQFELSDLLIFIVTHPKIIIKPVKIFLQKIQRGKNTDITLFINNVKGIRVGCINIEYFIQNLFFENQFNKQEQNKIPQNIDVRKVILKKLKKSDYIKYPYCKQNLNRSRESNSLDERREAEYQKIMIRMLGVKRRQINSYLFGNIRSHDLSHYSLNSKGSIRDKSKTTEQTFN